MSFRAAKLQQNIQLNAVRGRIVAPSLYESRHVRGYFGVEKQLFACIGMYESEGTGVQGLSRTGGEAIAHESIVRCRAESAQGCIAAVACIVEQCVAYVAHMHPYLVCASGLEHAAHN